MKNLSLILILMLGTLGVYAQDTRNLVIINPPNQTASVVKIIAGNFDENRDFQRSLMGSGVIIDSRGIVVTSRGVVFPKNSNRELPEIWAGVLDAKRPSLRPNQAFRLRLIAHDAQLDIALLKIETSNQNQTFSAIKFGETGDLRYGQDLKLIGFMQANGTSLSTADVSFLDFDDRQDLLKIEGQFLNGVGGGAVVDRNGRLVGIPVRAVGSQFVPFFNQDGDEIGRIADEEVGLVVPIEAIQEFVRSVPNLVSFTIQGDTRQNVAIEGAITDKQNNQPIRNATIGILMPNNNSQQYIESFELLAYARTDVRGGFRLNRRIKPGVYSVKIVHPDYKTEYQTIQIPTNTGKIFVAMTKESGKIVAKQ